MGDLLSRPAAARPRLRELLARPEPLVAPGAYDALSARLVEQAGFDVVYMTGFGTTASLAGRPDVGLLTGTEMVDNARRIAAAVDVPVIADADTGYGNAINVVRTVQAYEQAGVAGHPPRRPGDAQEVRPHERQGGDPGRRDGGQDPRGRRGPARPGFPADRAHRRGRRRGAAPPRSTGPGLRRRGRGRALRRGADQRGRHRAASPTELRGVAPLVFNWAEGGRTPPIPLARIAELGFALVLFPIGTLLAATAGDPAAARLPSATDGVAAPRWTTCRRSTASPTSSACPRSVSWRPASAPRDGQGVGSGARAGPATRRCPARGPGASPRAALRAAATPPRSPRGRRCRAAGRRAR